MVVSAVNFLCMHYVLYISSGGSSRIFGVFSSRLAALRSAPAALDSMFGGSLLLRAYDGENAYRIEVIDKNFLREYWSTVDRNNAKRRGRQFF